MYSPILIPTLLAVLGPLGRSVGTLHPPAGGPRSDRDAGDGQLALVRPQLVAAVSQILRQSRKPSAAERAVMLEDIAKLGSQAIRACLYLLEHPVLDEHPSLQRQALNRYQRELLLTALAAQPRENVGRVLNAALQERSQELPLRVAAIEVLGRVGSTSDLERLLQLALSDTETELNKSVEAVLPGACASFTRRNGLPAYDALEIHWPQLQSPLVECMLLGFGELKDARALGLIADTLRFHAEHHGLAVSQILHVGRGTNDRAAREAAHLVRGLLDKDRPHLASLAARALGVLEDTQSIPTLIDMLDAPSEGMRSAASWALQTFTGHQFAGDAASHWRLWWSAESTADQGTV